MDPPEAVLQSVANGLGAERTLMANNKPTMDPIDQSQLAVSMEKQAHPDNPPTEEIVHIYTGLNAETVADSEGSLDTKTSAGAHAGSDAHVTRVSSDNALTTSRPVAGLHSLIGSSSSELSRALASTASCVILSGQEDANGSAVATVGYAEHACEECQRLKTECERLKVEQTAVYAKCLRLRARIVDTGTMLGVVDKQKVKIRTQAATIKTQATKLEKAMKANPLLVDQVKLHKKEIEAQKRSNTALLAVIKEYEEKMTGLDANTGNASSELQTRCNQLEDTIKQKDDAMRAKEAHIRQLTAAATDTENMVKKESVLGVRKELKAAKEETARHMADLNKAHKLQDKSEKELGKLREEIVKLKENVKEIKEEARQHKEERKVLLLEKKKFEKEKEKVSFHKSLQEANSKLEREVIKYQSDANTLREKLRLANAAALATSEGQETSAHDSGKVAAMTETHAALKSKVGNLETTIAVLTEEIDPHQVTIAKSIEERHSAAAANEELQSRYNELSHEFNALVDRDPVSTASRDGLVDSDGHRKPDVLALKRIIMELETQCTRLTAQVAELKYEATGSKHRGDEVDMWQLDRGDVMVNPPPPATHHTHVNKHITDRAHSESHGVDSELLDMDLDLHRHALRQPHQSIGIIGSGHADPQSGVKLQVESPSSDESNRAHHVTLLSSIAGASPSKHTEKMTPKAPTSMQEYHHMHPEHMLSPISPLGAAILPLHTPVAAQPVQSPALKANSGLQTHTSMRSHASKNNSLHHHDTSGDGDKRMRRVSFATDDGLDLTSEDELSHSESNMDAVTASRTQPMPADNDAYTDADDGQVAWTTVAIDLSSNRGGAATVLDAETERVVGAEKHIPTAFTNLDNGIRMHEPSPSVPMSHHEFKLRHPSVAVAISPMPPMCASPRKPLREESVRISGAVSLRSDTRVPTSRNADSQNVSVRIPKEAGVRKSNSKAARGKRTNKSIKAKAIKAAMAKVVEEEQAMMLLKKQPQADTTSQQNHANTVLSRSVVEGVQHIPLSHKQMGAHTIAMNTEDGTHAHANADNVQPTRPTPKPRPVPKPRPKAMVLRPVVLTEKPVPKPRPRPAARPQDAMCSTSLAYGNSNTQKRNGTDSQTQQAVQGSSTSVYPDIHTRKRDEPRTPSRASSQKQVVPWSESANLETETITTSVGETPQTDSKAPKTYGAKSASREKHAQINSTSTARADTESGTRSPKQASGVSVDMTYKASTSQNATPALLLRELSHLSDEHTVDHSGVGKPASENHTSVQEELPCGREPQSPRIQQTDPATPIPEHSEAQHVPGSSMPAVSRDAVMSSPSRANQKRTYEAAETTLTSFTALTSAMPPASLLDRTDGEKNIGVRLAGDVDEIATEDVGQRRNPRKRAKRALGRSDSPHAAGAHSAVEGTEAGVQNIDTQRRVYGQTEENLPSNTPPGAESAACDTSRNSRIKNSRGTSHINSLARSRMELSIQSYMSVGAHQLGSSGSRRRRVHAQAQAHSVVRGLAVSRLREVYSDKSLQVRVDVRTLLNKAQQAMYPSVFNKALTELKHLLTAQGATGWVALETELLSSWLSSARVAARTVCNGQASSPVPVKTHTKHREPKTHTPSSTENGGTLGERGPGVLSPRRTRSCRKNRVTSSSVEDSSAQRRAHESDSEDEMRLDVEPETVAEQVCGCSQDWCACAVLRDVSVDDAWLAKEPVSETDDRLARLATHLSEYYQASFGEIERVNMDEDYDTITVGDNRTSDVALASEIVSALVADVPTHSYSERVSSQNGEQQVEADKLQTNDQNENSPNNPRKGCFTSDWMHGLLASLAEHVHTQAVHASRGLSIPESPTGGPHTSTRNAQGVQRDEETVQASDVVDSDAEALEDLTDLHTSAALSSLYTVLSVTDAVSPQPAYTLCSDLVMSTRVHPSVCAVLFTYISRAVPSLLRVEQSTQKSNASVEKDMNGTVDAADVIVVDLNDQTIVSTTLQCALSTRLADTGFGTGDSTGQTVKERAAANDKHKNGIRADHAGTPEQASRLSVGKLKHIFAHSRLAHMRLVTHRGWLDIRSAAQMTEECVEWCMAHLGVCEDSNPRGESSVEGEATENRIFFNQVYNAGNDSPLVVFDDPMMVAGPLFLLRVLFKTIADANNTHAYRYFYENVARVCVDSYSQYRAARLGPGVGVAAILILGVGGATFRAKCLSAKDRKMRQVLLDLLSTVIHLNDPDPVDVLADTAVLCGGT
ncbi:hypothetical protein SARC_02097 [Sphaeroforma arctica JP610]|uniref:Uncharacterized protein n=1 Tax=Sphaeroforma arctica JP610 TaxID=667725 RepID=A0A0L0GBU5_9EUKA|nr:hypothetical protein SARC_02097 [Sphaeroforma arctica JP610]KNC85723.1 hypothetical protein SARC_02097 [Sphaeroforma arctica JP610]|eukprot:XP_014159625.1 hypothetical protein SARC_02097 [Sphaeroforma arctica JP610]